MNTTETWEGRTSPFTKVEVLVAHGGTTPAHTLEVESGQTVVDGMGVGRLPLEWGAPGQKSTHTHKVIVNNTKID